MPEYFNFFNIYYDILSFLSMLFEGWIAQRLFRAFVEPRMRARFAKYAVGIFWAAINMLFSFLLENGTGQFILLIKLIIYTFGMTLFTVIWYNGSILKKLFPVLLFSVIRELSVQATNCLTFLNTFIIDIFWKLTDNTHLIPIEVFPTLSYVTICFVSTLVILFRALISYRSLSVIIKSYRKNRTEFGKEDVLNLLPSAVALTVCAMLRIILITIENGYTVIIYERYPALYIVVPIMSLGLLAAVVYSFKLYQDMTELRQSQADRAVLENQLVGMQNALAEKERLYESFRAVRHDIKNSLTALRGLISRKCPDDEEINRYFESMSLSFVQAENSAATGNSVCDAIISGKFRAAKDEFGEIALSADGFFFTDEVKADPYDMGLILSNGLDNAIEACRRLREKDGKAQLFITLRSFRRKNMFIAEIENSFDGVLKLDDKSGLPASLKENSSLHGIGLRNIRNCAEKYSGGMDFIVESTKFTLSVMLKS